MSVQSLLDTLSLPVIAAPMFLVSGPELVIAACRSGVVGGFPSLNQRTAESYEQWLDTIAEGLAQGPFPGVKHNGPVAVNLNVHKTNLRLDADLKITLRHKVPVVITSLGAVKEIVQAVHDYGGLVFHDAISLRHAEKALDAGVDGVIAVCAGAGGHGGTLNPFGFVYELRRMTDKAVILAGAISTGRQVAAARIAGADMVSMGTAFIATTESRAQQAYKDMLTRSSAGDIVYTPKISGVNANFIAQSIRDNGIDLVNYAGHGPADMAAETSDEGKAWRDIWSAGHGVGAIRDIPGVAEMVARMRQDYDPIARALAA